MKGLMSPMTNATTAIHVTDLATCNSVLSNSKVDAAEYSTDNGTIAPTITLREDAHAKADRYNLISQAVIGAKEGAAVGITAIIDSDTTEDNNVKGVNEYSLAELVTAAIAGADRPATRDVLDQLQEALGMTFDFPKEKKS